MLKYCPSCGAPDLDLEEVGEEHDFSYDVHCSSCGFSGDISPDIPLSDEED